MGQAHPVPSNNHTFHRSSRWDNLACHTLSHLTGTACHSVCRSVPCIASDTLTFHRSSRWVQPGDLQRIAHSAHHASHCASHHVRIVPCIASDTLTLLRVCRWVQPTRPTKAKYLLSLPCQPMGQHTHAHKLVSQHNLIVFSVSADGSIINKGLMPYPMPV